MKLVRRDVTVEVKSNNERSAYQALRELRKLGFLDIPEQLKQEKRNDPER
jgi:ribosomal protein S18 acetylase RimI-like enzyme